MPKHLLLPLDGRPCNAAFPVALASMAGCQLLTPPLESLGNARQPARREALTQWLASRLEPGSVLFLSLDTWVYGNLVASRKNREALADLRQRLQSLCELQAEHQLQIHAFATLLRLSNSNDDTEERPYWAQHGQEIYRFSWLEHALASGLEQPELAAEYAALQAIVPAEVLADYRGLRQRNLALLEQVLAAVGAGHFSSLLIGCDDGGEYGWTRQEKAHLQSQIAAQGLEAQVLIYPGADELACSLVARTLVPEPLAVEVHWSHPEACEQTTRYEGVPLLQTLQAHAQAVGLQLQSAAAKHAEANPTEAKPTEAPAGLLWVHNPPTGQAQIDQFLDRNTRLPLAENALERLKSSLLDSELPLALADVAYANGGDIAWLKALEAEGLLLALSAYAGWNTSGNTLGCLLAWFKIYLHGLKNPQAHQRFLLERLADDGWYQGHLRQQLSSHYSDPVTLQTCLQLISELNTRCQAWQQAAPELPAGLQVKRLTFPWKRFFEIELALCFQNTNC